MAKILNRGLAINTNGEDALKVNGVQLVDKDGKIYGDIHAAAGSISATELATDAVETAKIKNDAVTTAKILNANVTLAKLATAIQPVYVVKFFVLGSSITGVTLEGLVAGDVILSILADGTTTVASCAAPDTLPADPADTTYLLVIRATA